MTHGSVVTAPIPLLSVVEAYDYFYPGWWKRPLPAWGSFICVGCSIAGHVAKAHNSPHDWPLLKRIVQIRRAAEAAGEGIRRVQERAR